MYVHTYTTYMPDVFQGQKRVLNPQELELDGSEPPCGYWELNSGPLEKQTP